MKAGETFGPSSWIEIPQEKIDAFAEATGDHQWIHVDPERAKDGPFGTTIGHGYLTLSLLPVASYEVIPREGDVAWRALFVAGMLAGAWAAGPVLGASVPVGPGASPAVIAAEYVQPVP